MHIFTQSLKTIAAVMLASMIMGQAVAKENAAESRSEIMMSAKAAMKAAMPMIKGQAPWDPAKAVLAARALNAVSYAIIKYVPEGSITGDSEASPKIWEDMKGFLASAKNLRDASANAAEAAKLDAEDFAAAFADAGKTCKGCHKVYRVKK